MDKDPKETLLKVLEIIEYPESKDQFVNEFIVVCKQQAIINLISNLPEDEQERLKEQSAQTDSAALLKSFHELFTDIEYEEALTNSTAQTFKQFLETIIPYLNKEQKDDLKNLLQDLIPAPQ
jgi:hypothetical protein